MKAVSERFTRHSGMRNLWRLPILPILMILGFVLCQVGAYAQLETGSIQGKVSDPSGAVVPKAATMKSDDQLNKGLELLKAKAA